MMKVLLLVGAILLIGGVYQLTTTATQESTAITAVDLPYVKNLDIDRFMGKWYVITAKPNLIEKNCHCARTVDTKVDGKTISLAETCMIFGKWITDTSKAVIEEESTGRWTNVAHGMKADYWIIDVDETNYSWSVIGQRNLSGYWIMSREKTLDQSQVDALLVKAKALGYNLSDLEVTDQTCKE